MEPMGSNRPLPEFLPPPDHPSPGSQWLLPGSADLPPREKIPEMGEGDDFGSFLEEVAAALDESLREELHGPDTDPTVDEVSTDGFFLDGARAEIDWVGVESRLAEAP